jgi:hypothetical protein
MKGFAMKKNCLLILVFILSFNTALFAEKLRGFGEVQETALKVSGNLSGFQYVCENPEKAKLLMHKLGRDLSQTATVPAAWKQVKLGAQTVPVLLRPGLGCFLPCVKGKVVSAYTAPDGQSPEEAFAKIANDLNGAQFFDPSFSYPAYLDKYSHYGIGSWYPSNWGDGNSKGKPNDVDDHFKFAREYDLTLQPNAGGYLLRNLLPKLHEYGRPYHFAEWQEWSPELAIMAPEELTTTNDQFSAMPHYYGQISDGGRRLMDWNNWMLQARVREHVNDPLLVDWADPNGEVGPFSEDYFWDFTENNRKNFVRYLCDIRGYTLKALGEAWYGDAKRFKSWDDVPIPMSYDLYGWTPESIMADRSWRIHPATPDKALQEGLAAGYQRDDFKDTNWVEFPAPGGELISTFWRANKAIWHRGSIDVPAEWLKKKRAAGPIYLAAATFTSARGFRNPDRVWINGQELAAWSHCPGYDLHTQFDVTNLLRPGKNTIAYLPPHNSFHGTFFLTDQPYEDYPFKDSHRNARYSDWREYIPWAITDMLEDTYKAIRAIDPDRFIKMHAFGHKDLGIPLAARYAAFGHNTGDEAFFRPWDRRFGYVRGIPSSAESSGSVDSPEHFKRWLGWHSFTGGLNALDYFHNIQSMMYSPAAELWKEYMPYWKLSPRRDLKKPDIALFWSSRNNGLLPRPVPYCFDLGRGDLQPLGYSYVYVDETTVRDGLVKDYPVIWDTGTFIMDPETVAGLKKYVENGGTYVLLQETGRHTMTQRDAWAVSDLTGFKVSEVRPMTGGLSIMNDQPLFKKLAGKTFYNRGKSIDYSDYNYADKCIALEPISKDTQVIARYDDGAIAIGMRTLGKGRVIVLGSPFWRDSYDQGGMWWPGESQSDFLEDIFAGLGLKPLATADTHRVWREHYFATNGTEEFLFLHNPYDEPVTFNTEWDAMQPVGKLFDPKNGQEIPGTVDGRTVRLNKITLKPRETLIVATQSVKAPEVVLHDWFGELSKIWRKSEGGKILERPDLPVYELRLAEKLSGKVLTPEEAAALPKIPEGLKLGACQSPAAFKATPDKVRRCVFTVNFKTPAKWRPEDGVILYIRGMNHAVGNVVGPVDAWLNGTKVFDQVITIAEGYNTLQGGAKAEVNKLLKPGGENVLVFTTASNGFEGEVDIQMHPAPVAGIEVAGSWQLQKDADSGLSTVALPGEMNGLYAYTSFDIPADWKGDRVFIDLDLTGNFNAFAINEKMIFHPVNWFSPVKYMDVTPWVKFGGANRLTLFTHAATQKWEPGKMEVKKIRVQRVKGDRK